MSFTELPGTDPALLPGWGDSNEKAVHGFLATKSATSVPFDGGPESMTAAQRIAYDGSDPEF